MGPRGTRDIVTEGRSTNGTWSQWDIRPTEREVLGHSSNETYDQCSIRSIGRRNQHVRTYFQRDLEPMEHTKSLARTQIMPISC